MESKNKKEELEIRKASSYDINFPDNKYLENSDKQRIQKAVTDGGISIGNKTFISEKELNKLLVTDRKGVTNAMMSTPPGDLKKVGDVNICRLHICRKRFLKNDSNQEVLRSKKN